MALRKGRGNNYLGVDVHKALLDRANRWTSARSLSGYVHYLQANAVLSAGSLLGSYPGPVALVSVQYPDPHQRRQRHIVGRELVEALSSVLKPGARVYLASDFEDTATYMRNGFERHGSDSFGMADVHTTRPVFPCASFAAPAAAMTSLPAVGECKPSSPEITGSNAEATETRATSDGAGAAGNSSASAMPSVADGVVGASGSGGSESQEGGLEREGRAGAVDDEDDLLWFQGSWQSAGWLVENPVGAPTEREVYVEKATKRRVYRALLVRV